MNIRRARTSDLPALDRIAFAAKAHWGYSTEQLEAWRSDLVTPPETLEDKPVFVAERGGSILGFVQLDPGTSPWQVEALWVAPGSMRQGVGTALVRQVKAYAAAQGQTELAVDSDPNAEGFYRACGGTVCAYVPAPIAGQPERKRPQLVLPMSR